MDRTTELELMRLLHGELPEEHRRRLERRLRQDEDLAVAFERLRRTWESLELPPPTPAPPGFAEATMARLPTVAGASLPAPLAPRPLLGAAAAALALVGGILLGSWLAGPVQPAAWEGLLADSPTLAESYWAALEEWSAVDPEAEVSP